MISMLMAGCRSYLDITVSRHQTGNVRTTLSLDDDVYEAALQLSKTSGERLGAVLSELARRGLKPREPKPGGKRRFPVFDVPADAPAIRASTVQKILDEEGVL
jgi:hypothetical protein